MTAGLEVDADADADADADVGDSYIFQDHRLKRLASKFLAISPPYRILDLTHSFFMDFPN